ncbi:MAG: type IV pilin N-terminal domain-containing protein [Candidatus Methanoperedens sp.]
MSKIFKKKTRNILRDESAVSPMIATIMLIAVVAVLGAVIAASSMKSAGDIDTSNLAVTLKASQAGTTDYNIILTHAGGDKLPTNKLTYSVTSGENSAPKFEKPFFGTVLDPGNNTLTIVNPNSDPTTFKAGETITFGAVTDGTLDISDGSLRVGNATAIDTTYHVVVRYDNKKVLYDSNIEIS